MQLDPGQVSVVNTLTGEVYDFQWDNIDTLRNAYQAIDATMKAFDRAKKKMTVALQSALGDNDEYIFPDGAKIKRYQREMIELRREDLAKYLDADQLDLVLHVNTREVKDLFTELVERGELPSGAFEDVKSTAFIKLSEPYIRIIN